tara:strand:+ start:315 stop:677 length:363 start_codon:yes stop_codon:yes gene_type:complete
METTRQKKVSKLLQKDIAEILQKKLKKQGSLGVLLSITKVSVTVDFSVAKVFLSVFPSQMSDQIIQEVSKMSSRIRHEVAQKAKKQLRKVPELLFFLDDSLDYIEKIEDSLKGLDNPLRK